MGVGAGSLSPFAFQSRAWGTDRTERHPKRFVFVVRSNGILTTEIQPQGLEHLVKTRANGGWQGKLHELDLGKYNLHPALQPLSDLQPYVNVFQGLSGKMCRGSHQANFGALGAYASGQGLPPRMETIDGALASHLGGIFPHLGFVMHDLGATVTYPQLSAVGPNKPLPFYADPGTAYKDLFGMLAAGGKAGEELEVDRNILDFMVDDIKRYQKKLGSQGKEKLNHYLEGFEAIQERRLKLKSMGKQLAKVAPEYKEHFTSEIEIERLKAHFELAGSALIGGLTQVVTIRADSMDMRLSGLGLGSKTVHAIGHMIEGKSGGNGGQPFDDGKGEFATRAVIMKFHMEQIAKLARQLKAIPEGDGTMLDNTLIVYLSDHGDRHHSKFNEWPMVTVGRIQGKLKSGRYMQLPGYGSSGHRTIANLYLSLLHAAGDPRDEFGQKDLKLDANIDQSGPLAEWMLS